MFGGKGEHINSVALFNKMSIVLKSFTYSYNWGRTEDMKLYKMDFEELCLTEVEEDNKIRPLEFEDSFMYSYFSENEFIIMVFREPKLEYSKQKHELYENTFLGFKRIVFNDDFLDGPVKTFWEDTRYKVMNNKLEFKEQKLKSGELRHNDSDGGVRGAPNFLKSSQNDVFMRGSGGDSSQKSKTSTINSLKMIPQYVWLKGKQVKDILDEMDFI